MRKIVLPAAVLIAALLAGCKSNRCCQQPACQPAPQCCAPQPPVCYAPPAPAPEMAYVPPAPPPPSQDAQLADMQARALDAERRAREAAEARAKNAEDALKIAISSPAPAPTAGGWSGGGGGEPAMAFAEELRTRCDAEIVQSGDAVVIRMSDAFRAGSDQLKPDVKLATTLHAVADALMRAPSAQVAVVGHSDGSPIKKSKEKWSDNVHLSRARADVVAHVLAEKGVAANRMSVDGRGDVEPLVYPERTASDRARNRRVEIHVRF